MPRSGFEYMDQAFESLGRAVILLDDQFRVIRVGRSFEKLMCEGAGALALNKNIHEMFFEYSPRVPIDLRELKKHGKVMEAKRSFLMCPLIGAVPVSLSAAPLCEDDCDDPSFPVKPCYIVALRPSMVDRLPHDASPEDTRMVAVSPAMKHIAGIAKNLAKSLSNVLITGESGTGKEVLARTIHEYAANNLPFVAVNCAAFPAELLENELFGHAKGAYTGAHKSQPGRLETAGKGTLFLDEIGDMPMNLQVKLLRVLQERTFFRLGESIERKVEARVIAATNRDLEKAIKEGRFREDLYYRLNVVPIRIPPLRERPEDLEALARYLLEKIGKRTGKALLLSDETIEKLSFYQWPGNVRELENALEYALTFCNGQHVQPHHLPTDLAALSPKSDQPRHFSSRQAPRFIFANRGLMVTENQEMELMEKEMILEKLEENQWNKAKTAKDLGMGRTTLYRKFQKLGIQ